MIFRLECLTEDHDPPSPSSIHVEHILVDLVNEPRALLRGHIIDCILSLRQPLSYITEEERLTMRKMALIADEGLPDAMANLIAPIQQPVNMNDLRLFRVSLAVIERALEDKEYGEQRILETMWNSESHGLVSHLVDIFLAISDRLKDNFLLTPPPRMPQILVEQLFRTGADLLKAIAHLASTCQPPSRLTSILTSSIADFFAYTDAAPLMHSKSSCTRHAAQIARQCCIDTLRSFAVRHDLASQSSSIPEVILRTLFRHGIQSGERDPVAHLLQVYCLLDCLLAGSEEEGDTEPSQWVVAAVPNILSDLEAFFRVLNVHNKANFFKRLVSLDNGVIGIGEWLLSQELKQLLCVLRSLVGGVGEKLGLVQRCEASMSLHFVFELLETSSSISMWCINVIEKNSEIAQATMNCLTSLVDGNLSSSHVLPIAQLLASNCSGFDPSLRFAIVLTLLRAVQNPDASISPLLSASLHILRGLPEDSMVFNRMGLEIGRIFSSEPALESLNEDTGGILLSILEWFSEYHTGFSTIRGITASAFTQRCIRMSQVLPPLRKSKLESIQAKIVVDERDASIPKVSHLAERIELSIEDVQELLHCHTPIPTTPKRTTPDVLGLVEVSPPSAILRSQATTGLTKTYLKNDFRQLRQLPSARQNTSRLPSLHVDVGIKGRSDLNTADALMI